MTNFKNINFMSRSRFNELSTVVQDELCAVEKYYDPDYSAPVSVANSTSYTVPVDGVILVAVAHNDKINNNLSINGIPVYNATMYGKNANGVLQPTNYIVKPGDVVLANRTLTFYPFK